ncbi:hypothetical protein AGDE_16390 [Angomonas deanei]|uniref:Uncharacterized protein n=1 Tax=Angomonas deanei TaxID=59799 RepID=A0A7G2C287_9TRYP|nr:hypothetical protein AGDE_16390 [Angomonas deanei]CAD2213850.1 hypothetical protein, conserved [Angomonas deanei]|eukprot:EPY17160.1 hypothetical protein AGDE_16390 [Angomonas deanei]
MYGRRYCEWRDEYVFAFSSDSDGASPGAWIMAVGFVFSIPTVVLSALFFHKSDRHDTRIPFYLALFRFILTLLSSSCSSVTTLCFFLDWFTHFNDSTIVIGPVMALLAMIPSYVTCVLLLVVPKVLV